LSGGARGPGSVLPGGAPCCACGRADVISHWTRASCSAGRAARACSWSPGRAHGAGRAGGAPWSGSAGRCARGCGRARGWRRPGRPRPSGRRRWWACRGASGCTRSPHAGDSTGTASGSAWSRCRGSARGRGARVTRPPGTCLRAPSKFAQVAAAATPLVLKVGWAALAHTLQHSGKHTSLAH